MGSNLLVPIFRDNKTVTHLSAELSRYRYRSVNGKYHSGF